jgi:hypothetical protein
MKSFLLFVCLFIVLAATPAVGATSHAISSTCPIFTTPTTNAQNMSEVPIVFSEDPAGDGTDSCSVDDCKVCNDNGLMCTPTKTGCNCDFWPE